MKQRRFRPQLSQLLIIIAILALAPLGRAEAGWILDDDDWIFGEWLLPCQYRSPPDPACRAYRRCRKVGRRWICSRWKRERLFPHHAHGKARARRGVKRARRR